MSVRLERMTTLETPPDVTDAASLAREAGAGSDATQPAGSWLAERPWLRGILVGLLSGLAGLAPVLIIAMAAVWTEPRSNHSASAALSVGALGWLALQGAWIEAGGLTISVLPLLLALLPLSCAALGAASVIREGAATDARSPRAVAVQLAWWWLGHLLCVASALALGLSLGVPARPVWWTLVGPILLVPLLAAAWAVTRHGPTPSGPWSWKLGAWSSKRGGGRLRVPLAVRRGVAPGLRGAVLLLAIGSIVVLAAVGLTWHEVTSVHAALETGVGGGIILTLLQVGALPNLAIWALSFLAGPGFQVVDGAGVSWAGAESGLLPLVPLFGALPQPGPFPDAIVLTALAPVLAGVVVGRWSLRRVARLSGLATKASTASVACLVAASSIALLDIVGGGALGAFRLSALGAPAGALFLALLVELLAGALAWVLWDAWRLRR